VEIQKITPLTAILITGRRHGAAPAVTLGEIASFLHHDEKTAAGVTGGNEFGFLHKLLNMERGQDNCLAFSFTSNLRTCLANARPSAAAPEGGEPRPEDSGREP